MSDLIERSVALEALKYYKHLEAYDIIRDAPAVEVVQGKWKAKSFHECFCDNCGFTFDIMKCDFLENMKFCPNCGAKMDGERREVGE